MLYSGFQCKVPLSKGGCAWGLNSAFGNLLSSLTFSGGDGGQLVHQQSLSNQVSPSQPNRVKIAAAGTGEEWGGAGRHR